MPFLENVLRGKNVPRERMLEVAEHYNHFGGISPINEQCRALIGAVRAELDRRGIRLPIYWGNRNWHPMLTDTLTQMTNDGRKRAIAFFTSMFSCYSGCRQYRENIAAAINLVGQEAPLVEKARMGFNHPKFIEAQSDCLKAALDKIAPEHRAATPVLFSAHSIPKSMADHSLRIAIARQQGSSANRSGTQTGKSSTKADPDHLSNHGSSRMSAIASKPSITNPRSPM